MSEVGDVLENMRGRAARCRRLARSILDKEAADVLNALAEEIEADISRLERSGPAQG
jgi:hypothetical protein